MKLKPTPKKEYKRYPKYYMLGLSIEQHNKIKGRAGLTGMSIRRMILLALEKLYKEVGIK